MAGLYIHIPFCDRKCAYCDFFSRPGANSRNNKKEPHASNRPADWKAELLGALSREMDYQREYITDGKVGTIYIGGGTPSLLAPEELQSLLERASGLWDCSEVNEATVEANPEDLTPGYVERLAATAFNRLSIGIQSFDDALLRKMNRRHSAQRARDAVRSAQQAGFGNITVDLIFGIPGMSQAQWERSLDEAVALGVQHISAYHLTIEPGTAFGHLAERGRFAPVDEAESERQYAALRRKLGDAGFEHYEISNFALPGYRARHNSAYWSGEPYLGIGPSAHSFNGKNRRAAVAADIRRYIAEAGGETLYETETLTAADLYNEFVMTSLRRSEGLDAALLELKFGPQMRREFTEEAERFVERGDMSRNGDIFTIPAERFLLSDYIMGALFTL